MCALSKEPGVHSCCHLRVVLVDTLLSQFVGRGLELRRPGERVGGVVAAMDVVAVQDVVLVVIGRSCG